MYSISQFSLQIELKIGVSDQELRGGSSGKGGSTVATIARTQSGMNQKVIGGIVGGLEGGLVFGGMMAMMGLLPMASDLAGSASAMVGFIIHVVISAAIGASFGVLSERAAQVSARAPSGGWFMGRSDGCSARW